jgi:enoyl-CoA hydratase/carnithine racemase
MVSFLAKKRGIDVSILKTPFSFPRMKKKNPQITAADIRYCSQDATFSVKEVDLALAADVGTLQRLPKVVGNQSVVRDWCLTGRRFDANEARETGLVSKVFETREALYGTCSWGDKIKKKRWMR